MNYKFVSCLVFATIALLNSAQAQDFQSLRCGSFIIVPGDSAAKVIERCGQPLEKKQAHRDKIIVRYTWHGKKVYPKPILVEIWKYRIPGRNVKQQLIFERGRLIDVRQDDDIGYNWRFD
ncbi:MAG: DUF2845 domain-containing protein [Pseudomonadota bacterium]